MTLTDYGPRWFPVWFCKECENSSVVLKLLKTLLVINSMRIELLNKDNYDTWRIHVEALLVKNDTWKYVSGEEAKPSTVAGDEATRQAISKWTIEDRKAKSDLILSMSPAQLKHLRNCETSKDVWDKLESVYASQGLSIKMHEEDHVRDHLTGYKDVVDKLHAMKI